MDHGMTRVFATLFDKDTEMIQQEIESFGMVRWDLCYILMIQQHIPFLVKWQLAATESSQYATYHIKMITPKEARTFITLFFYNLVVAQKPT